MLNSNYLDYFCSMSSEKEDAKDYSNQRNLPEVLFQRQP